MATGGTELCVFLLHLHLHLHIYIYICHKVSREVGERREGIRGLCWQLVELLEDKFLARLPALPKLMPNILRRGKHKKLSSLNRRRGPEKIIVITPPQKVMSFSILSIYRFVLWGMLLQIFEPLSACFTFIGKFSCHSVSAMISL